MYRLKVDWCGFKPGEEVHYSDMANCYACKNKQGESIWVSAKQDLPTLIEHGIIEEVPEKQDAELKAFLKQQLDEGIAEISGAVRKLPFIGFDTDGNMRVIGFMPYILFSNKTKPKGEIQHTWTDDDLIEFYSWVNSKALNPMANSYVVDKCMREFKRIKGIK